MWVTVRHTGIFNRSFDHCTIAAIEGILLILQEIVKELRIFRVCVSRATNRSISVLIRVGTRNFKRNFCPNARHTGHCKNWASNSINTEKALRKTQTLRAGCSKAEPKNIRLAADPFPGARDGQNLISWRWSLPLPTKPVW